jgi:hypothetical protein
MSSCPSWFNGCPRRQGQSLVPKQPWQNRVKAIVADAPFHTT